MTKTKGGGNAPMYGGSKSAKMTKGKSKGMVKSPAGNLCK